MDRLDRIKGCLIGGAAGDALGYAVEFRSEKNIFDEYGEKGITEYSIRSYSKKARVSDDTQMTLFTAQGILEAYEALGKKCCDSSVRQHIAKCYQEWLFTQDTQFGENSAQGHSWLCGVPELFARRAPGNTCLMALGTRKHRSAPENYIADKLNNSCGCGGVMRAAPLGFIPCEDITLIDMEAAQAAAITHSHSLGYIPAAILAHIVHRLIYPVQSLPTLAEIVEEAGFTAGRLFEGDENIKKQLDTLRLAAKLSENNAPDLDNIHALGEGWVGDEALNIAVYCALRYCDDFSAGLAASVNHRGDSDSTGAVCGNILGAAVGLSGIGEKWTEKLELVDVMEKLAEGFV